MYQRMMDYAKKHGVSEIEFYVLEKEELEIGLFHGEIDTYQVSKLKTIAARGLYQGKMGYASSEKFEKGVEKKLIKALINNAKLVSSSDPEELYGGESAYPQLETFTPTLPSESVQSKMKRLHQIEKAILAYDTRIVDVADNVYNEVTKTVSIVNSLGLQVQRKSNYGLYYATAVAKGLEGSKDGSAIQYFHHTKDFDRDALVKEACETALSKLGAKPVASGAYKVLIQNKVMVNLLPLILQSTFADNVQKGYSMLGDKLKTSIAASCFSVIEDPLTIHSFLGNAFDDEGVATQTKRIIDRGVLTTFVHSLKTAKKAGVSSTGNGYKAGVNAPVDVSLAYTYVEPGTASLDDLVQQVGQGLLLTSLQGLHSGLDAISGNFSLQAAGFVIENGKVGRPVSLITVAGNLFTLLQDIEAVGNDSRNGFNPMVVSPSLIVKQLMVSGK